MSPEERQRIIITGQASEALNDIGIDTTGDDRPAIEILEYFEPALARELSLRAETLCALDNKV